MSDGDDPLWLLAGFLLGSQSQRSQRPPGHRHGDWWHHHDLPPGGWHDHPYGLDGPQRVLDPPEWWLQRQAFWRLARWARAAIVLALMPHVLADVAAVVAGAVTVRRYDQWRAWADRSRPEDPDVEVLETRREPPRGPYEEIPWTRADPPPRPGDVIRLRRPVIAFYPEGHPRRTTHHGPLLKTDWEFVYVGPDARPGVHVVRTPPTVNGTVWEVFFRVSDVVRDA